MSTATRGFASMSKARRREVSRQGALAGHRNGRGYHWTSDTARVAGEVGGVASGIARRAKRIAFRKAHPYREDIVIPAHWRQLPPGRRPKPEPVVAPALVVPEPVPVVVAPVPVIPPVDPLTLLAQHLRKVATDALVRSRNSGAADKK